MSAEDTPKKASFRDHVFYHAYRLLCGALRMVDVRLIALIGRGVGYLVWATMPRRRRIVARNLRIVVDPTLRPAQLAPMVRRNIVRTTMNLACSLKTGLMTEKEMARSIRVEGGDIFEANGSGGQTVISCIPHAGNWEALARIRPIFHRVKHFGSMYRRLSNPMLESFVYQSRTRYGCEMFSKEEGLRAVMKLARNGGLLGVLSDQFTAEGIYLPYFGKVTGVTPLPALLYKRCKGKGHLFSVFTRNTGLGKWDTVLGREIHLPEGCDSLPAITMQVNLALEKCQNENILDGFWMHHRWKITSLFAPELDDDTRAVIAEHVRLPFRMIVCPPEEESLAKRLVPFVKKLSSCRPDAEVTLACPEAQAEFWQQQEGVVRVITTDGAVSVAAQLDEEEVYKDGPFDMIFMYSYDKRLPGQFASLLPIHMVGWEDHPCARKFRTRYEREEGRTGYPSDAEFAEAVREYHNIVL